MQDFDREILCMLIYDNVSVKTRLYAIGLEVLSVFMIYASINSKCEHPPGKCVKGWISDMEIDVPTFVSKSGHFLLIWVKVCLKKLAFSYSLSQFFWDGFQNKMIHFCPWFGFFGCCFLKVLPKNYLKGNLFTKKAPWA